MYHVTNSHHSFKRQEAKKSPAKWRYYTGKPPPHFSPFATFQRGEIEMLCRPHSLDV